MTPPKHILTTFDDALTALRNNVLIMSTLDLLIRFQPVASDLRRVVAAMKLSSNLERIADESVSVARRARKLNRHRELPEVERIMLMGAQAMQMFRDSVDAYVREDDAQGRALKGAGQPT